MRKLRELEFQVAATEVQRPAHLLQHFGAASGGGVVAVAGQLRDAGFLARDTLFALQDMTLGHREQIFGGLVTHHQTVALSGLARERRACWYGMDIGNPASG
jgi:hypothetical protein